MLTVGGNGYNPGSSNTADHVFPGNPSDLQGWNLCNQNNIYADRAMLGSHGPFSFAAGDTFRIRVGFTLHADIPHPCPDVYGLVEPVIEQLQQWYDDGVIDLDPKMAPLYTLAPGQSLTLNATVPQATYAWSTGATTPNINISATGTYSVTITGATGCTRTETTLVQMGLGAGEQTAEPQSRIWPNPANDQFHVQCADGGSNEIVASLFDAQGRLIKRMSGPASGFSLPVKEQPAGLYWLEIQNEKHLLGGPKIVVQH